MKRMGLPMLVVVLLAVLLGLFACSSGASSSGSSGASGVESASSSAEASSSPGESVSAQSAEEVASIGSASSEATSGSAAEAEPGGAQAAGFDFVDECTDEHGNITLYALTELKGWQLETLLDQQGYEWDEDKLSWTRRVDGASFSAYKETGTYKRETYDQMNEKGGAIVAVGFNVVAGYEDPQAALSGNAKCVIEDSFFDGGDGIAIFYGPSMKEYLAIISKYSESTSQIMIFSQEAVGSGMADEMLGTPVGGTFRDVWRSVTGKDSYGH